MSSLRNRVRMIGNITDIPQRVDDNFVKAKIVTNDTCLDQDGNKRYLSSIHRLVFSGKQADLAMKYIDKGKEVAVEGRLLYDFQKSKKARIHVDEILLL